MAQMETFCDTILSALTLQIESNVGDDIEFIHNGHHVMIYIIVLNFHSDALRHSLARHDVMP